MRKTVLTYGFISGALAAAFMLATMPFHAHSARLSGVYRRLHGIVLATLLVFFGVRSYRENVGDGRIRFGRGSWWAFSSRSSRARATSRPGS